LEYDCPVDTDPLPSTFQTPSPRPTAPKTPQQEFMLLLNEYLVNAKSFPYQWGKAPEETVHWNIVTENESIDWGMPDFENHMATDQIDFDDDTKLVDILSSIYSHKSKGTPRNLISTWQIRRPSFMKQSNMTRSSFRMKTLRTPSGRLAKLTRY
jgi:hypothetical protein